MAQDKLKQAQQLLKQKRYEEAAAILVALPDNPIAQKWLTQLEEQNLVAADSAKTVAPSRQHDDLLNLRPDVKAPANVKQVPQRTGGFYRLFIGFCLTVLIALQIVMISILLRNVEVSGSVDINNALRLDEPVEVTGAVQLADTAGLTMAVRQDVQRWEVLEVEAGILGVTVNGEPVIFKGTFNEYLNRLGEEGWEVVSVGYYETKEAYSTTTWVHTVAYLKRPKGGDANSAGGDLAYAPETDRPNR